MALPAVEWMKVTSSDDEREFEQLFLAEYPRVVNIAYRIIGERQAAEDVGQEAFLAFHRRYRPSVDFAAPWLHRAASHLALNSIRDRGRRTKREEMGRDNLQQLSGSFGADPADSVTLMEQQREVQGVLARLPRASATVLALRYSGLSYAEIAAALGCRTGQVGTRLKRAEEAFRKEFSK